MKSAHTSLVRLAIFALIITICTSCTAFAFAKQDKRKATKIQSATVAVGKNKAAVEVRYLNLPWGETTFGYIENGGNQYYSNRTWPFAHLKLGVKAKFNGSEITPGDYVMYITPKSGDTPMTLSIASFKPNSTGTFLQDGNVFTETPKDVVEVAKKAVTFEKGDTLINELKIDLASDKSDVAFKVHYGNRLMTEKLNLK